MEEAGSTHTNMEHPDGQTAGEAGVPRRRHNQKWSNTSCTPGTLRDVQHPVKDSVAVNNCRAGSTRPGEPRGGDVHGYLPTYDVPTPMC